jgi:hypothetical protein
MEGRWKVGFDENKSNIWQLESDKINDLCTWKGTWISYVYII